MEKAYLFADFGSWLGGHGHTFSEARKLGCMSIFECSEEGYVIPALAETWAEVFGVSLDEIFPDGPRSMEELADLLALVPEAQAAVLQEPVPVQPPVQSRRVYKPRAKRAPRPPQIRRSLKSVMPIVLDEQVISPRYVIQTVSKLMNCTPEEITGDSQQPHHLEARRVTLRLCRQFTKASFPELGKLFNGRHHTTIMKYATDTSDIVNHYVELGQEILTKEIAQGEAQVSLTVEIPVSVYKELVEQTKLRGLVPDYIVTEAIKDILPRLTPSDQWVTFSIHETL